MKKLVILLVLLVLATNVFSQIENDIAQAVSSLNREPSFTNNLYLQGQVLSLVKNGSHSELLNAYQKEGFKRFTKMIYIDGTRTMTITATNDSTFSAILDEVQRGLPKTISSYPTSTDTENLIDDYVTDYWIYTNNAGKKCEIRVYFINDQLRSIGYWIYE
jgi:hypothetical protein